MRTPGKFLRPALLLLSGFMVLLPQAAAESMSEKTLKEIVARQRNVFSRAEKEGEQLDQAWLRGELQSVINS